MSLLVSKFPWWWDKKEGGWGENKIRIKGKPLPEAIYKHGFLFFLLTFLLSSNSWVAVGSLTAQAPKALRRILQPC